MKITKTSSGKFRAVVRISGAVKTITADDKKSLLLRIAELEAEQEADDGTIAEYAHRYIDIKKPVLSPSTVRGYNSLYKNHIEGRKIGSVKLSMLNNERIQAWIGELFIDDLSPKTVRNALGFLSAVLDMYRNVLYQ